MKISLSSVWKGTFVLLLFQMALIYNLGDSFFASVISYLDEVLSVVCLMYIVFHVPRKKDFSKNERIFCSTALIIFFIGVVSSIVHMSNEFFPIIIDALNCNKFIVIMIATIIYSKRKNSLFKVLPALNSFVKFCSYTMAILAVSNIFLNIFPTHGYRLFLPVQKLFFEHPNDLACFGLICAIVLLYNSRNHNNDLCMVAITVLIITTMRIRLVACILVIWVVYLYFVKMKMKSKLLLGLAIFAVAMLVGYEQIMNYYGNSAETRTIVTITSFQLANKYFPLGLGFASYGTNMARAYYSPIYEVLGFTRIWGLNAENDTFLTDQFWPAVIGQFGWIGLILFIIMIIYLYKIIAPIQKKDIYLYATTLSLFIYEIMTSLGETAYYNPLATIVFFIVGICIAQAKEIDTRG